MEAELADEDAPASAGSPRLSAWVATIVVLVLCAVAASSGVIDLWEDPDRSGSPTVRPIDDGPPDEPDEPDRAGAVDWPDLGWMVDIVSVLALVVLVAAVVLLIRDRHRSTWRWRWPFGRRAARDRNRGPSEPPALPVEVDVGAAVEALAVGTPRNGIVRCWMQLELDAATVGLERDPSETAAEYVERVVASTSVDPGPIGELASLYREARFSRHELTDAHRERARRALAGVAAELAARPRERS